MPRASRSACAARPTARSTCRGKRVGRGPWGAGGRWTRRRGRVRAARGQAGTRRGGRCPRAERAVMRPMLTHLALGVRDLDRTIAFYKKHVRLHVVHERIDGDMRVVWLGEREKDVDFVLVLFQVNDL